MKIEGDVVTFETQGVFYEREKNGLKPYTIRFLDPTEYHALTVSEIKKICIRDCLSEADVHFERVILSIYPLVEILGKVLTGIAWIHEEEKELPEQ